MLHECSHIGHPEPAARKQMLAITIIGERAGLTYQPVYDVVVADTVVGAATLTREPHQSGARGPRPQAHVKEGHDPGARPEETRQLLFSIENPSLPGLRDRALIG
jgi:hypothetical protein